MSDWPEGVRTAAGDFAAVYRRADGHAGQIVVAGNGEGKPARYMATGMRARSVKAPGGGTIAPLAAAEAFAGSANVARAAESAGFY
jgi:hypothetical protein